MLKRYCRYQAAIVRDDQILLIQHREEAGRVYWVIPGGGIEGDETEPACVAREALEETNLVVEVVELLLDEPHAGTVYERTKTYLCRVISGEASPGHEPEFEQGGPYAIAGVGWFDLARPESWDPLVAEDRWTWPLMDRIRIALGYA